jgi:anti-anti-sigma factor
MLDIKDNNEIIEIKLPGNIKTAESQSMEDDLMELANTNDKIISMNFEDVGFICSHFLKVCLRLNNTLSKERFHLTNLNPEIKRVFMIAGFEKILNIK